MSSKHRIYRGRLTDGQLERAIANASNLVEIGTRRVMNLESAAEPDQQEIRKNRVLLRAVIAHLRLLESEKESRWRDE